MDDSTLWWLLAGGAVALELITGTFVLLMLGLGMVAGALAAHAGANVATQLSLAAAVGGGAAIACYWLKKKHATGMPAGADPNMNLDIGETVQVARWHFDGTAQVKYRGAHWTAVQRPGNLPEAGPHRVAEIVGNRLLLEKI